MPFTGWTPIHYPAYSPKNENTILPPWQEKFRVHPSQEAAIKGTPSGPSTASIFSRAWNSFFSFAKKAVTAVWAFLKRERGLVAACVVGVATVIVLKSMMRKFTELDELVSYRSSELNMLAQKQRRDEETLRKLIQCHNSLDRTVNTLHSALSKMNAIKSEWYSSAAHYE